MLFRYEAITNNGEKNVGTVEAASRDLAIGAIQRRGLIVSSIREDKGPRRWSEITIFGNGIKMKDVVVMSRQISTLFEAQVSALKAFSLLATNTQNKGLAKILEDVSSDIQAGSNISTALAKHPNVFSDFYVNMVKSGEESGKLDKTFSYLADYMDRQYDLTSKTKNALIYPAFVISIFIVVMILMFVFIVPKLTVVIQQTGQAIPFSTKLVIGISDLFIHYWLFLVLGLAALAIYLIRVFNTTSGKKYMDHLKIKIPIFKDIYVKLYLSRIADNLNTMLTSGISIVRAIELTSGVVGNYIFESILKDVAEEVKGGESLADAFSKHEEIPPIMSGMVRVGEETGSISGILKTLGDFYSREVNDAVDTLVSLIEPLMIVVLGLGVGLLLTSVLMPIYNIAGGIH